MSDCSPLGAALAGFLGLGIFKSLDEIAAMKTGEIVYQPTNNNTQASALYAGWQRAVRQVLP